MGNIPLLPSSGRMGNILFFPSNGIMANIPLLPSNGIKGILTHINDLAPVTPESRGGAEVVVVGPDPDGIPAAGVHPQPETAGGDPQDLPGKGLVLLIRRLIKTQN